jgi:PAS domain S-box-containing protein
MTQPQWVRDRETLDWIGVALFVVARADGEILHVNQPGAKLFGYDADQILGRPIGLLVPPASAPNAPSTTTRSGSSRRN